MSNFLNLVHPRDEDLKKKWEREDDYIPVNESQFSFDSRSRERDFITAQFCSKKELERYEWYREEWFRRAKEFDPGEIPLAVTCELVSFCNLSCPMCYTITEEFQSSVVGSQRILPWETVIKIIDECATLGVPSMLFSWRGEPSLYRSESNGTTYGFGDVLSYARKRGILEITSLTNGRNIDENMAEAIVEAEPSWISFSVDGLEEAYNQIRRPKEVEIGESPFLKVVENIKRVIRIRDAAGKTRPRIRINTIYPAIAKDPLRYYRAMRNIGVDWVTVNELLDFRGEEIPEEDIRKDWACQYPFQRLTVSASGVILPCTGAHNEEHSLVLGRYVDTKPKRVRREDGSFDILDFPQITLKEAWKSEKLNKIRDLHKQKRRVEIDPGCRYCRHGAKKHGVTWIPPDWDMESMQWKGHKWRMH